MIICSHVVAVVGPVRVLLEHVEERGERPNLLASLGIGQPGLDSGLRQNFLHSVLVAGGRVHQDELGFVLDENLMDRSRSIDRPRSTQAKPASAVPRARRLKRRSRLKFSTETLHCVGSGANRCDNGKSRIE